MELYLYSISGPFWPVLGPTSNCTRNIAWNEPTSNIIQSVNTVRQKGPDKTFTNYKGAKHCVETSEIRDYNSRKDIFSYFGARAPSGAGPHSQGF